MMMSVAVMSMMPVMTMMSVVMSVAAESLIIESLVKSLIEDEALSS